LGQQQGETLEQFDRLFMVAAGLAGFAGVALSAMAAHGPGGPNLDTAARFLLIHAAALVGLAALLSGGALSLAVGRIAGLLLIAGLVLFCGDLVRRAFADQPLFPMAAPTGGFVLMAGWALVALAGLMGPSR
jgi:uncharacterized membrane protein YgdD (TMEM256/DUF423 family)